MLGEEQSDGVTSCVLRLEERVTLNDGSSALVQDVLCDKHPSARTPAERILMEGKPPQVNPIRFEALTASLLRKVGL